jgi:predicted O-linked N-acetylglucosamine transferase (SPINDLY family)
LVDLSGHTGGNRLLAFARRPAPIQASYLGYLGTTGLRAIDYFITDEHADPPGLTDEFYQEELIRLPECAICYSPGPAPEVAADLPARHSDRLTFGCLNNPAKVTDEVLFLWGRLLKEIAGSQLLIATGGSRRVEDRIRSSLAHEGLTPDRLLFTRPVATRTDYLKLYDRVDIGLDPFPYNGVTTTCDALWMGVPVISLAGRANPSRQGVRFLRNAGLDDLLAETPEEYVRKAIELSGDHLRLAVLHRSLRELMSRSPLMNSEKVTRNLEATFLAMWRRRLGDCQTIKVP